MINILIPMAGIGKRFQEAGYKDPKPFIPVGNTTMIEAVINNLIPSSPLLSDFRFIIVTQESFFETYHQILFWIEKLYKNVKFITIDRVTDGPAETCLAAKELINNNDPLLIANCDQIVNDNNWINNFLLYYSNKEVDGGILCILANHKKWSFIDIVDDSKIVSRCIEKQPITPIATTGHYFFKCGKDFVRGAEYVVKTNIRSNNEFYVSNVIQYLIDQKQIFKPYVVNSFSPIGTPEDLEKYLCGDIL